MPACQHCGGEMRKTTNNTGVSLVSGVLITLFGLMLFFLPPYGWAIGCVVILAAVLSGKKEKVWLCPDCRTTIPRM